MIAFILGLIVGVWIGAIAAVVILDGLLSVSEDEL